MKCSVYVSLYGRNCRQDETNLLEEVAGKRENVKERGVSERGGDLPVFGQRMRRVGLRRKKKEKKKKIRVGRKSEDQLMLVISSSTKNK